MVADAMTPARQANGFANVALAERAAGMGPVTMHGYLKQMSGRGRNQAQSRSRNAAGFTRRGAARQPRGGTFRHCEPPGSRECAPDDRLREANPSFRKRGHGSQ